MGKKAASKGSKRRQNETRAFVSAQDYPGPGFNSTSYLSDTGALALSAVWASASILSNNISRLPLEVYVKNADHSESLVDAPEVIENPSPEMTRQDFVSEMVMSLLFRGNSYSLIVERDDFGFARTLFNIADGYVQVSRDGSFGKIRYDIGELGRVDPSDLLHVRGIHFPGELVGLSPLGAVRQVFQSALQTQQHSADSFKSGVPSVAIMPAQDFDQADVDVMAQKWSSVHSGPSRVPAFLPSGTEIKTLSITAEEQQMIETMHFGILEIARIFGIPAFLLSENEGHSSWGQGLEIQGTAFVRYSLSNWLSKLEEGFSSLLPKGMYCRFNTEELLRGSVLERYQVGEIGVKNGLLKPNEFRKQEHLPMLDEDTITIPKDISSLATAPPLPETRSIEFRAAGMEAGAEGILTGYAAVFNNVYRNPDGRLEKMLPGSLEVDPDVWLEVNHGVVPLARAPHNLEVRSDDTGLKVIAHLDLTDADGLALWKKVKRRDYKSMSLAMQVLKDKTVDGVREISRAVIRRVAVVHTPANPLTSVEVRSQGDPDE